MPTFERLLEVCLLKGGKVGHKPHNANSPLQKLKQWLFPCQGQGSGFRGSDAYITTCNIHWVTFASYRLSGMVSVGLLA